MSRRTLSLSAKRRLVVVLLVLFAAWPVVHGFLVERYAINPWRLFGWAMYCVPTYEPQVRFFGRTGDEGGELIFPQGHPRAEVERIRFIRARGQVGDWASGELLAARLFEIYPRLDELVIVVSHPIYRSDTRSFEPVIRRLPYERLAEPTTSP